jgi:hypothetical protein
MEFTEIYTTEFLSELNLVLTQEDFGNKLYDLLTPIKNLLQKDNDLLTYSLARYCGANSRLAFTCEWYLLTNSLTLNCEPLIAENKKHFLKKINPKYKNLRNLDELVENDIKSTFLPLQLSFLNLKAKEFMDEQITKYPYLVKYLNSSFLSQFTTSELQLHKSLYTDSVSLNQYIDIQGSRTSFVYVSLPCLIGFTYSFNQHDNFVNPKGIKWSLLEDVFRQIASLHQMKDDQGFIRVVYEASLDSQQEISWLEMDEQAKSQISFQNEAAIEVIQMLRDRIYEKLKQDIDNLVFPDKYKTMIKELASWAHIHGHFKLKLQ